MRRPLAFLRRGPWRYARDADIWQALAVVVAVVLATLGLVWLGYAVYAWRIARHSPVRPRRASVVLVFGRRLHANRPGCVYRARLQRCLALMHEGMAERVLLLGGASGSRCSEAQAGADWLRAHGAPPAVALMLEQASTDSLENLRHARALLSTGTAPRVCLVSSRYHLPRCLWLARRLGLEAEPVAAEAHMPLHVAYLRRLLVEATYVMWLDLGLRWARLSGRQRLMSRLV